MNVAVNSYLDSFLATQIWMTWQVLGESLPLGEADSLKSLAPCRHRVKLVLPFLSSLWKALKSLNDIEWQWHQHEVSWSCIRVSQIFSALMHTCVKDVLCLVAFCLRYKAQNRSDEDPLASRRGPQGHILHGIREVAKEPSATRRTIEWGFPGMPWGYWMISTISASACSSYICIHMHAAWPYAFSSGWLQAHAWPYVCFLISLGTSKLYAFPVCKFYAFWIIILMKKMSWRI